ncbi:MAG: hypothetical protein AB7I27_17565 [Bacteriovoracaceae bacterium]
MKKLMIALTFPFIAMADETYKVELPIKFSYFNKIFTEARQKYVKEVAPDCGTQDNCEYPFGTIVDNKVRKLTETEVKLQDAKRDHYGQGPKIYKLPIYIKREVKNGVQNFSFGSNTREIYSQKHFAGRQVFNIVPTSNGRSLMLRACSLHPGATVYGDEISGSYVAYFKPHRVRHDEQTDVSFKINPGTISFDSMSFCSATKIKLNDDGSVSVELLRITPRVQGVKWAGASARVTDVDSVGWLGDFGKVLGTLLGPVGLIADYASMKLGGGISGLSSGPVNEAIMKWYINEKIIPAKLEEAAAEKVNEASFEKLLSKDVQSKVGKAGVPGEFLKKFIFSSNLNTSLWKLQNINNELIISPTARVTKKCLDLANDLIENKVSIKGLEKSCNLISTQMAVKVKPFMADQASQEKGCYETYFTSNEGKDCYIRPQIEAKIGLDLKKLIEPVISLVKEDLVLNVSKKDRTDKFHKILNDLMIKFKGEKVETLLGCDKKATNGAPVGTTTIRTVNSRVVLRNISNCNAYYPCNKNGSNYDGMILKYNDTMFAHRVAARYVAGLAPASNEISPYFNAYSKPIEGKAGQFCYYVDNPFAQEAEQLKKK